MPHEDRNSQRCKIFCLQQDEKTNKKIMTIFKLTTF